MGEGGQKEQTCGYATVGGRWRLGNSSNSTVVSFKVAEGRELQSSAQKGKACNRVQRWVVKGSEEPHLVTHFTVRTSSPSVVSETDAQLCVHYPSIEDEGIPGLRQEINPTWYRRPRPPASGAICPASLTPAGPEQGPSLSPQRPEGTAGRWGWLQGSWPGSQPFPGPSWGPGEPGKPERCCGFYPDLFPRLQIPRLSSFEDAELRLAPHPGPFPLAPPSLYPGSSFGCCLNKHPSLAANLTCHGRLCCAWGRWNLGLVTRGPQNLPLRPHSGLYTSPVAAAAAPPH